MLSCCLIAALASAQTPPPALRKLCIDAPLVVLARPVDPAVPTRFVVTAVLRGKGTKVGDELRPTNLADDEVRSFDTIDPETKKPRPRRVAVAMLFLQPDEAKKSIRVMTAGYRFCTDDGRVLTPVAPPDEAARRGPHVAEGMKWPDLLAHVRSDVAAVDRLNAAHKLPRPQQRVRALTDWLQRRRGELTRSSASASDLAPGGWHGLETRAFDWIFADATDAEAWAAVRLFAALNRNGLPRFATPRFATAEGRALLVGVALDNNALTGDRRRALRLLSDSLVGCDDKAALIDKLKPLLSEPDAELSAQTALAFVECCRDEGKVRPASMGVVNALASAYRAAPAGRPRDELAWALCRLAPAEQYQKATNNPAGLCVRLGDFSHDGDEITFFLDLDATRVHERPTLVIEKLGPKGEIATATKTPLDVVNPGTHWPDGIDGALAVRLDVGRLVSSERGGRVDRRTPPPAIVYRVRVEGVVGKDKRPWRSEPRLFSLDAALQAKLFEPKY